MQARSDAALIFQTDETPGIRRSGKPGHFSYRHASGRDVRQTATLERIRLLAVPPAWTDVWISAHANAHLQATGRDARGRKQYRYHTAFRASRDAAKFEHMFAFVTALPAIRQRVALDMARRGLPRAKVVATIVRLLETTLIRVGNADYAAQNDSYGLTTLRDRHAKISGDTLKFVFKGKSGKAWKLDVRHRRVARIVKQAQDLPGQHLFQYEGDDGRPHKITSTDVNAYLHEIAGTDVTAKDYRTWAGTVLAAVALATGETFASEAEGKRLMKTAIADVSARLGNTPAICRKCYIHPGIFDAFLAQELREPVRATVRRATSGKSPVHALRPEERAVVRLLWPKRRSRARALGA